MPIPQVELFGSTMRDKVHKGPNQAGNKSLLAYRADIGIPGYTGFIPVTAGLAVPVKGFDHTGRPADSATLARLAVATVDPQKTTQYQTEYGKVSPGGAKPPSREGGGYWISQRVLPPSMPFVASTTYRAEVVSGAPTAAAALARSDGLASTLVGYEAARQANDVRRSQSASPRIRAEHTARGIGTQTIHAGVAGLSAEAIAAAAAEPSYSMRRPATVATTHGELPGYQTTYGSMTDKSARELADSMLLRPATTGSAQQHGDQRWKTMPRVMAPGMIRNYTSYAQEYGGDGVDPMTRQASDKATMTRTAVTRDLASGTTRNASHIPRYTGHIPSSPYPTLEGRIQGAAEEARPDHKASSLLHGLDQYSRSRVPGYTGHKPQGPHASVTQPAQGPPTATTAGEAALRATRFGVPSQNHENYINSRTGLMTFFNNSNTGTEFVSDNGIFNAQVYYKECKALGALGIKGSRASATTHYGATFRAAASMV